MRYQRSYLFVFQQPRWPHNLLYTAACALIPLVGWALLVGYLSEVLESMHERPEEPYPDFSANRAADYLMRGLGSFLVQVLVLSPLLLLAVVAVAAGALTTGTDDNRTTARILATVVTVGVVLLTLLLGVVLQPLTLHVGLSQELALAAAWQFAQNFLTRVWKEAALAQVFVLVTGLSLFVVGLLFCGIGGSFSLALAGFAQYHLLGQLYALYLQRGGAPVTAETQEPALAGR